MTKASPEPKGIDGIEGTLYWLFTKDPSCNYYLNKPERVQEDIDRAKSSLAKVLVEAMEGMKKKSPKGKTVMSNYDWDKYRSRENGRRNYNQAISDCIDRVREVMK